MNDTIVFFDLEIQANGEKILDLGAITLSGKEFHSSRISGFTKFISDYKYICGHNIFQHDLNYICDVVASANINYMIDTLVLSPLLFPKKPYHALLKDEKLQVDELNNPLNDSIKAKQLFLDEVIAFNNLSEHLQQIYYLLLRQHKEFFGFFHYMDFESTEENLVDLICQEFGGEICTNAPLDILSQNYPVELAYCLAVLSVKDRQSITPSWVQKTYPKTGNILRILRNIPCDNMCTYCNRKLNIHVQLKRKFDYDAFRKYGDEPLQEKAVEAAVKNKSLLAIFPTGGGKSLTFQLPALMAGEATKGLTVVISPLQSLMKDQVDNLSRRGIVDAVTINGLLDTIERAEAIERVMSGLASLLYIAPESLRSKTIENILLSRNVVRFVIDEAHCFSAWGQDFRVDYLYIGDFIQRIQEKKNTQIPVSCFTATAKQKVISDIREYFKQKLNIELELFATNETRKNLHYEVLYRETDTDKYLTLRSLIEQKNCSTIVYVSRTKRTMEIAEKLSNDGFAARAFHGKMDVQEKIANQEAFLNDEVQIIVATSAFGMGVDKSDVKLVVHYDISDSLENYVQESGRAGRDQSIQADCYVLFNEEDLDKHFILLNQTKLSISEIQQVWKAIKDLTRGRRSICQSTLEIARQAGWDETMNDIETKVKTAISALETAGYIKRGRNSPRIYATSIQAKNAKEALQRIEYSTRYDEKHKVYATRIIKSLISSRSRSKVGDNEAEARVDYMADRLGIPKEDVVETIYMMREDGLLADDKDLVAFIKHSESRNRSKQILSRFSRLEVYILSTLDEKEQWINYKEINEKALEENVKVSTVNNIRTIFYFWIIKQYIAKPTEVNKNGIIIEPVIKLHRFSEKVQKRIRISEYIVDYLFDKVESNFRKDDIRDDIPVEFSVGELQKILFQYGMNETTIQEVEEALLYLSKIGAMRLEGGFLISYSAMQIERLEMDNKIRYKQEDYRQLKEFYQNKAQQIHIVGEYANMMVRNYEEALTFVNDYFQMEYRLFLTKYFKGERKTDIERNITPRKYQKLFEGLSSKQAEIINDMNSQYIVVAAGPGSGKTKILVNKLASLLLLEEVKHEQLLMLTFSRAAVTEFKKRLVDLIGNAANFIEIKTFHSYCFDLLGKIGNLEKAENIVQEATRMICEEEVELGKITKTVVVVDEAQDMDEHEYALLEALMKRNDEMRVLLVGDDDQNIYAFRGSDSRYMTLVLERDNSNFYEMTENYRSHKKIVAFANEFANTISQRMKTQPLQAVQHENGKVWLIRNQSSCMEKSVVNLIKNTWSEEENITACVLTNTNEEALRIYSVLAKSGYKVRLLQTNDGFNIYNLAEIRYFLEQLYTQYNTPVIEEAIWDAAKKKLKEKYNRSECLSNCLNLINDFEMEMQRKYISDFENFVRESRYENFFREKQKEIVISTIHKAKGKEFDNVYLLLRDAALDSDIKKRQIYVGITRAKQNLYITYNNCFDNISKEAATFYHDSKTYSELEEIVMQLGHKDIVLSYGNDSNEEVLKNLQSGDELEIEEKDDELGMYMCVSHNGKKVRILKVSKNGTEKIIKNRNKGYVPIKAKVRFVVWWHEEGKEKEYRIVLPDITLVKGVT